EKLMNKIRIAIVFIYLSIAGVMLTVGGISDIIKLNTDMAIFNIDDMRNAKKGDIVCGIMWNVYANYANETTTNTTMGVETSSYTSREYFVMGVYPDESEEEFYITLSASKKDDIDMLRQVINFESNNEDWDNHPEYPIYAKVKSLDSDLNSFLVEGIESWEIFDSRAEVQRHIVPFELAVYNPKTAYTNLIIGLILIAVVIIACFVVWRIIMPKRIAPAVHEPPSAVPDNANGFAEKYTPPQPMPNVSQPVQPDDFFPAPKPKPEPESKPKPEPKKEPPKPVSVNNYEDTNLDTSGMNAEQDLYEQEQAIAANVRHVEYDNQLETSDLDTDQKLYEQEQAIAANARHIEYDNQLETSDLDTEHKLYEQEQAIAAKARHIEYDNQLETHDLDTDRQLTEQEQAIAANTRQMEYDNEIDTSDLNTDSLDYYDTSAQGEDDDIFIFSNDYDYEEADASKIEISD
ncbi:MAG: hypothetical protein K2N71_12950, partial [Oscillospiraceae bacterium]|nr:hypothetical protein [Oscillospiraceae bacterium]